MLLPVFALFTLHQQLGMKRDVRKSIQPQPCDLVTCQFCCATYFKVASLQIIKAKQSFQRVEVSREEALEMFGENKFKVEIIGGLQPGSRITLYRCGDMVDLCRGPHLPNTGYLKTAMVGALNRAFWRGDTKKEPLQVAWLLTDLSRCKHALHKLKTHRQYQLALGRIKIIRVVCLYGCGVCFCCVCLQNTAEF